MVALPDPILGNAICAAIACTADCEISERDVLRHCTQNLEDFMVPKVIRFWEELPKTNTGKVSHRLIREKLASEQQKCE